jgi:hypothetical protein
VAAHLKTEPDDVTAATIPNRPNYNIAVEADPLAAFGVEIHRALSKISD